MKKFKSLEEADRANKLYYQALTPKERIDMLIQMIDDQYGTEHRLERVPGAVRKLRFSDLT